MDSKELDLIKAKAICEGLEQALFDKWQYIVETLRKTLDSETFYQLSPERFNAAIVSCSNTLYDMLDLHEEWVKNKEQKE